MIAEVKQSEGGQGGLYKVGRSKGYNGPDLKSSLVGS